MAKMFLTYTGSVDAFKEARKDGKSYEDLYENSIVFISGADGNGEAVYTHHQYFGNINEALSNLVYFSKINVGGTEATAAGAASTLAFSATDPTTIDLAVNSTGITIGLSEAFMDRFSAMESILSGSGEGDDTVAGQIAGALSAANKYTDDEIAELKEIVDENTEAIGVVSGDYLKSTDRTELETAIAEAKQEAITTILGDGKIDEKFDTLKEIADWLTTDETGAMGLQTDVAKNREDIGKLQDDLGELTTNVNDHLADVANYTVNGKHISTSPVLTAGDINTTNNGTVDVAVDNLFAMWEWGEA